MTERCQQAAGKLPYTEADARNAMESMRPTDPRQDLLEVYPCPPWASTLTAEHWHVGHADPADRAPRRFRSKPPEPTLTHTLADALPPHLRALADGGVA